MAGEGEGQGNTKPNGQEGGAFQGEDLGAAFTPEGDGGEAGGGGKGAEAGNKGGDGKGEGAGGEQPGTGAPESYEDFDIPEGMTEDAEAMAEFKEQAKASGYSQEQAQAALNLIAGALTRNVEASAAFWRQNTEKWASASRTQGLMASENLTHAEAGLRAAGGDAELVGLLKQTGLSRHPAFIKVFAAYGRARSEDDIATRGHGGGGGGQRPTADVLYDAPPKAASH